MKKFLKKLDDLLARATQAEYDGSEALKDEAEESRDLTEAGMTEIVHAEPGALQAVKSAIKGHGEQTVLPDECQFGDNDLCYVDA